MSNDITTSHKEDKIVPNYKVHFARLIISRKSKVLSFACSRARTYVQQKTTRDSTNNKKTWKSNIRQTRLIDDFSPRTRCKNKINYTYIIHIHLSHSVFGEINICSLMHLRSRANVHKVVRLLIATSTCHLSPRRTNCDEMLCICIFFFLYSFLFEEAYIHQIWRRV